MHIKWLLPFLIALGTTNLTGQNFPKASLEAKGDFKNQWYSAELHALQEPSLYALSKDASAESYRFLWLRTFHHPVAVRLVVNPDGTSTLITKVASGAAGFRPGELSQQQTLLLSQPQTLAFTKRVTDLGFWKAPNPVNDQQGTDGSQWIIEGVKSGHYHVVDRWSPNKGIVHELGLLLAFDLAKMDIPKNEIY